MFMVMHMHDIWNPWHGCVRCSEGCDHCYMYYLDAQRDRDGARIYRTANFDYPLRRTKTGAYQIRSGEMLRVCMTSDFFLEEADPWRSEAWDVIRTRPDVKFFLLTKRPQRIAAHLPPDWGDGWPNVFMNVTCENQRRADERIPILLALPFAHKGVMCAPMIGPVEIGGYLDSRQIEQVTCGGENYGGERPCRYEWVKALSEECRIRNVAFSFIETGTCFIKDGRMYRLPGKRLQSVMAYKAGLNTLGEAHPYMLTDPLGNVLRTEELYQPSWGVPCQRCGSRLVCNGCARCRRCMWEE